MGSKFSFGEIQFDVSLGSAAARARRDPEAPFGLAVLGDFSGRANRGLREPIGQRRIWRVDCDNLDHVIGKLDASLRLPLSSTSSPPPVANPPAAPTTDLHFPSLEHFHPDQFLKQVAPLAALVEQRQRLLNPSTALAAASELQTLLAHQPAQSPAAAPPPPGNPGRARRRRRLQPSGDGREAAPAGGHRWGRRRRMNCPGGAGAAGGWGGDRRPWWPEP